MKKLILIIILLGIVLTGLKAQNNVSINVTGFEKSSGKLYVALFDSKAPFLGKEATGKIGEIMGQTTNIVFENIEDGEYAIAVFHDENNNGKLDLGNYGIPTEKYGFSNNIDPAVVQRPPVFDECKFNVKGNTEISIKLVSAIK